MKTDRTVHVSLSYDPDPTLAEVYLATASIRDRLLQSGFLETSVEPAPDRPGGLRLAERLLFRNDCANPEKIASSAGLSTRGAPQSEGAAALAREVRGRLDDGVCPEEILILYRHWGEEAELALETLRAWKIPASSDLPRQLRGEPSAAALRLAASIPLEEWETELIIRLLRHGHLRPEWPGADRLGLARAATTIKATGVFRGSTQLLHNLDRLATLPDRTDSQVAMQAAHAIAERLIKVLAPLNQERPWSAQAAELDRVARELGFEREESSPFDALWDALDDQADMLDRLGRGNEPWSWTAFLAEVDAILDQVEIPPAVVPGSILVTTVERAVGARRTRGARRPRRGQLSSA